MVNKIGFIILIFLIVYFVVFFTLQISHFKYTYDSLFVSPSKCFLSVYNYLFNINFSDIGEIEIVIVMIDVKSIDLNQVFENVGV